MTQPCQNVQIPWRRRRVASIDRHPNFCQRTIRLETWRHDSHQSAQLTIHRKTFAEDARIQPKLIVPRLVTHHKNGMSSGLPVCWNDAASQQRRNAIKLEGICRHIRALQLACPFPVVDERQRVAVAGNIFKRRSYSVEIRPRATQDVKRFSRAKNPWSQALA